MVVAVVNVREVEDVVYEHSQHRGVVLDIAAVFLLFLIAFHEPRDCQKLGIADYRIERSSDLVAHILNKMSLHSIGLFCLFLGFAEFIYIIGNQDGEADDGGDDDENQERKNLVDSGLLLQDVLTQLVVFKHYIGLSECDTHLTFVSSRLLGCYFVIYCDDELRLPVGHRKGGQVCKILKTVRNRQLIDVQVPISGNQPVGHLQDVLSLTVCT